MPHFNLLDEGWIPCLRSSHAPPELLSIRKVFQQAPGLVRITDPAPTVTVAIHRLLLAILHRALNAPQDHEEWGTIWQRGMWDCARLDDYLTRCHPRFDLFDAEHPFYQTTGLDDRVFRDFTQVTHERASARNRPLLFDHSLPGSDVSPDAAARYLIAQQNFSVGGMFSTNRGEGPREKFAQGTPLLTSAVCLAVGSNIFETLMLNWYQYNREAEVPFPFAGDDRPAWERHEPIVPGTERRPDGWVDLLTWQSRRIALRPTVREDGTVRVTHVALLQGYRLPATFEPRLAETMVAYVTLAKPQPDSSPWMPVGLTEGKAVWRDSHALFQSLPGMRQRPRVLDWLRELMDNGYLKERGVIPLDVYGLIPDQANIVDWRHESLPLPTAFIERPEMVDALQQGLELAERVGQLLIPRILNIPVQPRPVKGPSPMRVLGEELLRYTSERTPDGRAASQLADHLSPAADYWSALEGVFRSFVEQLATDFTADQYGNLVQRGHAARTWGQAVRRIAERCFSETLRSLETSARTLKASARAEARFQQCMRALITAYGASLPNGQPVRHAG